MEVFLLWPLLVLIRSDFRERQVGVPALLAFGGIQWGICIAESGTAVFAERVLENFLLLVVCGHNALPSVYKSGYHWLYTHHITNGNHLSIFF